VVHLWGAGAIGSPEVHRLPLRQAAEAHRRMGERSHMGKILLDPEHR
jgi:hypothetical protein